MKPHLVSLTESLRHRKVHKAKKVKVDNQTPFLWLVWQIASPPPQPQQSHSPKHMNHKRSKQLLQNVWQKWFLQIFLFNKWNGLIGPNICLEMCGGGQGVGRIIKLLVLTWRTTRLGACFTASAIFSFWFLQYSLQLRSENKESCDTTRDGKSCKFFKYFISSLRLFFKSVFYLSAKKGQFNTKLAEHVKILSKQAKRKPPKKNTQKLFG